MNRKNNVTRAVVGLSPAGRSIQSAAYQQRLSLIEDFADFDDSDYSFIQAIEQAEKRGIGLMVANVEQITHSYSRASVLMRSGVPLFVAGQNGEIKPLALVRMMSQPVPQATRPENVLQRMRERRYGYKRQRA